MVKRAGKKGEDVLAEGFLSASLSSGDLQKRLKVVAGKLESYGEDDVELAQRELGPLSKSLGEKWLIQHKNKDTRLLHGCCLAYIFKVYAPDTPYDDDTQAEVIKLFVKLMRGFESASMTPDNLSFTVYYKLLETLSEVSVFSTIPELHDHRDELLPLLVKACYDIAGSMTHPSAAKVVEHVTNILCNVMEETENFSVEVLDIVLLAFTQQYKKENSKGCDMMKEVLARCPNNFQRAVQHELQQIKAGHRNSSDLTNGNLLSEAVFEIALIAPNVLNLVLPAFAEDLTQGETQTRICAIKLLGALFSVGNFYKDFREVFVDFKRRTGDKDVNVRRAMVSVMHTLVSDKSELSSIFMQDKWSVNGEDREAPMRTLMLDVDERVRKDTIDAVVELCVQNGDSVPESLLRLIGDRVKDKKVIVRHAALSGLSTLYQKYCAPFDRSAMSDNITDKYAWIPSQIIGLYRVDQESRSVVTKCIEDICLSPKDSDRPLSAVALDFWCVLDAPGRDGMVSMLKRRNQFSELFLRLVNMRDQFGGGDLDDPQGGAVEGDLITKMSGWFVDPAKSVTMLRMLPDIKTSKVWEALESLVLKPQPWSEVLKIQADTLKKLGPRSDLCAPVKAVIAKLGDQHFGVDFVTTLLQGALDRSDAAEDGLAILPHLSQTNPRLFWDQSKPLESLLVKRADDVLVSMPLLKALATASDCLDALRTRKPLLRRLKDLCTNESWKVVKYATRTLIRLGGEGCDEMRSVVDSCLGSLSLDSPTLPSVLAALSEAARRAPDLLSPVDRDTVIEFVCDSLLKHSMAAGGGKKSAAAGRQAACDCRVLGLKLATFVVLGQDDPSHDEDPESAAALLATLSGPVVELLGNMAANKDSAWDKTSPKAERAVLRAAAGSCLIKMAKVTHLEKSIKPQTFVAMARLVQDEDDSVKAVFVKKLAKGVLKEHGKLPFKFAAMLSLAAHDAKEADSCKAFLRHTVSLMRSLQRSKKWINVIPEHIVPWLVFLLANTPDHLEDEDDTQTVSVSMKKHLDFFLAACLQGQDGENNYLAMLEIFDFIKHCEIKWDSACDDYDPKLVLRNVGLCAELGHRLVKKLGESRRWNNEGVTCSISRIVEGCGLFSRVQGGKPVSYASQLPPELALSPIKSKPSPAASRARPAAAKAGGDTPTRQRAKAPAAKKGKAAPKVTKPARGGKGRKQTIDDIDSSDEEEEEEEEREERSTSTARRSIGSTMEDGGRLSGRSTQSSSLSPPSKPAPTLPERKSTRSEAASEGGGGKRGEAQVGGKRKASKAAASDTKQKQAKGASAAAKNSTPAKLRDSKESDFDYDQDAQTDNGPASPPTVAAPRSRSSAASRSSKVASPADKGKENDSPPEKRVASAAGAGLKRARESASHYGGAGGKAKAVGGKEVPKRARASDSHFSSGLGPVGEGISQSQTTTDMWGQALKDLRPTASALGKPKKKRRL